MSLLTNPGFVPLQTAVFKGGNFLAEVSFADFAAAITGSALTINLFTTIGAAQGLFLEHSELLQPFADTSDTNNASTAITVGDAGSSNRYLASTEMNLNGSYVPLSFGTGTKYVPAVGGNTTVQLTATPTSGKSLANLKQGKLALYFGLRDSTNTQGLN